ncbi:hypothetical protein FKW77_008270 [Venturia effusa]|uniref:HbrB-like protein n=1 Tax=Venturia effusa TaxID=50376 RepID=A0A517LEB0_9PEZI|nr:hypothetical protein FKW77_008270 [Venturia effusa]
MPSPSKSNVRSPTPRQSEEVARERRRALSVSSQEDSDSSRATTTTKSSPFIPKRSLYEGQANASTTSVTSFSRPLQRPSIERNVRIPAQEPTTAGSGWTPGHRPRQHSQGFFDPTIASASSPISAAPMNGLTASQMAAQVAMHSQNSHVRKRSQTLPDPSAQPPPSTRRPPPIPVAASQMQSNPNLRNYDGFIGGHSLAAAAAANTAYPRSPSYSPHPQSSPQLPPERVPPPVPEKDIKPTKKESKMKLFSGPKKIGIYSSRDVDRKHPALPSPNKIGNYSTTTLPKPANASTTSLGDSNVSSASSFYSAANASTSTLVPLDREKEKEKHKHHFLSRQKNKLKDKDDFHLPLSSASSTSKPTDPNAPQPLYSFAAPSSPGPTSTFAKSVSGLDLRHGGRALREKKKEEKAASLAPVISNNSTLLETPFRERDNSFSHGTDWPMPSSYSSVSNVFGPATSATNVSSTSDFGISQSGLGSIGATFGVPGMGPDDAWPLLKAKLLHIFEGEDPRPPIEDFNSLVSVHLKRCIQRRAPTIILEDLNELLQTGFLSLDQTLRTIPDERLVPYLVSMWMLVLSTILPFMQAVFLPLDLEFKGRGVMTAREAADFWGAALPSDSEVSDPNANKNIPILGEELDVRRITLLKFRDTVMLPRIDALMAIFSRLSLDSISAGISQDPLEPPSSLRPGTASSTDAALSPFVANSFNSQSSTHLDSASPFSASGRSRATSNTSAGSFHSSVGAHSSRSEGMPPPPPPMDSAQVTEMVGRMLQCVSVLASVQSCDEAQSKMETLTKTLKLNWLGRGRTGRQRRGFVGTRSRPAPVVGGMA